MKITKRHLRRIISEELRLVRESRPSVFKVLNRAIRGGRILANPSIDGLFDTGLSMTSGEVKSRITTKLLGLNALELGLIGLAIGVPMLFFDEYSNAQKGDEIARYMSKSLRRPVEMKDIIDPRDPGNRDKIVRQGGSLKSNPILYLSSQENTNTAAQLFRDEIIAKDVFKAVQEIHQEKLQAAKQIKAMKSESDLQEGKHPLHWMYGKVKEQLEIQSDIEDAIHDSISEVIESGVPWYNMAEAGLVIKDMLDRDIILEIVDKYRSPIYDGNSIVRYEVDIGRLPDMLREISSAVNDGISHLTSPK